MIRGTCDHVLSVRTRYMTVKNTPDASIRSGCLFKRFPVIGKLSEVIPCHQ